MRKLLFIIALICCAGSARAQNSNPSNQASLPVQAQNVMAVNRSSVTCNGMSISQTTPTQVAGSTVAFQAAWVYVENEDAAANLFCNELSYVTTSGASRGKKITPGNWAQWTLKPGEPFYCISDAGGSTNAMICKGK